MSTALQDLANIATNETLWQTVHSNEMNKKNYKTYKDNKNVIYTTELSNSSVIIAQHNGSMTLIKLVLRT